jgi:hypothetical protein
VLENGQLKIVAGGADIWGTSDQFQFASRSQVGDFDVAVNLHEFVPAHLYSKAGLMARETMAADSPHVYIMAFADNKARNKNNGGLEFQYRTVAGQKSFAIYPVIRPNEAPEFPADYPHVWLRLKRTGKEFQSSYSKDGKTWKLYSSHTADLPERVFLGLAVTSHSDGKSASLKCGELVQVK